MSQARYDKRSGYHGAFANEEIKYGKEMHDKHYGAQADCPDWNMMNADDYAQVSNFCKKSGGVRTMKFGDGTNAPLAREKTNIGGREYGLDDQGSLRLMSTSWLQGEIDTIASYQKYINSTAKAIIHGGDRLAVQIMGLDGFYALPSAADDMVAEMAKAAGGRTRPTADPRIVHQFDFWHRYGGSAQMLKIEARPSILRTYPSTSEAFSLGVNKIMFMLEKLNIAFDDDLVQSEKVGAPVENVAKSAPHSVKSPADAL